jgi:hypothetical protein
VIVRVGGLRSSSAEFSRIALRVAAAVLGHLRVRKG